MSQIYNFQNTDEFVKKSAEAIETFILENLKEKKVVRVALSGGSSPIPVYQALSKSKIPWNRVALFLVDERYVPLNSKESNYGMIKENLADHVKNLRKFYHYNTRDSIQTIVDQYQKMLQQFKSPIFDLVILGLGKDGHTASLFPNDPALHEKNRLAAHTINPDQGQDRMTLTFPAILDSQKIIFLIQGKNKNQIIDRWLNKEALMDELPAKKILEHSDVEIFFLN